MLTERQREVLEFIRDEQRNRGITPSRAEIQAHFGFASPNAVNSHLRLLEQKGALKREGNIARSLVLTGSLPARRSMEVPIYGSIPAGFAEDSRQEADGCVTVDLETIRLPKGARVFALKVKGDSMINAGILHGDIVVMEFKDPRNNDVVSALIDGETTLKRYVVQRNKPFLKAENPKYRDLIPAQELVIQGVMVALLRVLKP